MKIKKPGISSLAVKSIMSKIDRTVSPI